MSFILDALRKSEHARQHLGGATLAELPLGRRPRGQPWWVFALAALLVVNLIVLSVVLLRKSPEPQPTPSAAAAVPVNTQTPTAAPAATAPAPIASAAPPPLAQEVSQPPAVEYETIPRSDSPLAETDGPTLVKRIDTAPPPPAISEMPTNANGVPELHIDMHAYAREPKDRFVYINKRKYSEGQVLKEGPRISEITVDGVVLLHQGQQFKLQRP